MKIGIVLPSIPAYSETFFKNKINFLKANGYEVLLFVNNSGDNVTTYYNVPVIEITELKSTSLKIRYIAKAIINTLFLNPKKSYQLFILNHKDHIKISKNIKSILLNYKILKYKLDWLHFGFATMAINRENIAKVIGANMGVSFRGYDYYFYEKSFPDCYKILFSKKVKYHVISKAMQNGLISRGINITNISIIYPAIDTNNFKPEEVLPNISCNKIINITSISRLHQVKGLNYIIEALQLLKQEKIKFKFVNIGEGAERENLEKLIIEYDLNNEIHLVGKKNTETIIDILKNTDIYLQYSLQEGFCNAVLEAQAMGLLCIVSDAEGLSENVIDGQTGWVIGKRNPKLLAEKIKEVIGYDTCVRDSVRHNAVTRVQQTFNLENQQKAFIKFYQQ